MNQRHRGTARRAGLGNVNRHVVADVYESVHDTVQRR